MSAALAQKWKKRLKQEEAAHKDYRDEAKRAQDAYLADEKDRKWLYPLFWSTVKVLHARIYSQPPKPDVRKRYNDEPGTKQLTPQMPPSDDNRMAQCIERAISYTIDTTDFDADGHAAVNDLLVAGLGVGKVELETETETQPIINPVTGQPLVDETGEVLTKEVITSQNVKLRAFSWAQFRWEPQQHWSQVSWIGFDHWMTADEIEDEFEKDVRDGQESGSGIETGDKPDADKYKSLFRVTEIWDKTTRKVIFITDVYDDTLDEREDSLGLEDFFPCPKPMFTNLKGDDLVPKPDYSFCEPLFGYVNKLTDRILKLTSQVKDIGFYDASFGELAQLPGRADGDLIPINGMAARFSAAGLPGKSAYEAVVAKQDNTGKVQVIQELMQLREAAKANIWETYGVSDIQRGNTDPNETATAQQIKAQWADVRVGERVRIVSLFFRDVFRLMAEIIAEHFTPEVLYAMTGVQLQPQEMEILRSDLGRCYAIDVESDSTVVQDEFAQKQQRLEFLNTVTGYIEKILPAMQQNALPADLAKELLLFAVNTFKNGRQLEQAINALPGTQQQMSQQQQQLQQAQQQNQELQKQLQQFQAGKEQRENIKTSVDAQKTQADTEKTQVETAKIAAETQGKIDENGVRRQFPFAA